MRSAFDVIVVGGGPAGATTAHVLAAAGVDVALLEKATFPRVKACGGGLQAKILRHLPADVTGVIRNAMRGVCFTHRLGERFTRLTSEPVVYGVLRAELDAFLVERAVQRGATLIERTRVEGFDDSSARGVSVSTTQGRFTARVLVGADGANGVVRRALNDEGAFLNQVGLYFEIQRERLREGRVDDAILRVDWGTLPSGYAWIFPKADVVNVGVGAPVALGRRLRPYLREFVAREGILKAPAPELEKLGVVGHKLPSFTPRTLVWRGNTLVVGDAAGLIDPFTGDGISYGVHSGRLAATAIGDCLAGRARDLSGYEAGLRAEIVPEIAHARTLMAWYSAFPRVVHHMFRRDDKVWETFCRALRGDAPYAALGRNRMGRLSIIWSFLMHGLTSLGGANPASTGAR